MAFGKKKKKAPAPIDSMCQGDKPLAFHFEPDLMMGVGSGEVRTFDSGATRDTDDGKPEFAGFLSADVLRAFGEYMHKHRFQKDGSMRASDNWKKGIPRAVYIESMFRHFMDVLSLHEYEKENPGANDWLADDQLEALMALLFNVMGYSYELLNGR